MHFTLTSGRRVSLARLHQTRTYAGVLAGKPGPRLNQDLIDAVVDEAERYGVARPRLIPPSAEAFAQRLPSIACIAVLESGELKGGTEPYSGMTVVWFQDEFGTPFPKEVDAHIRAIDWEAEAQEWCP